MTAQQTAQVKALIEQWRALADEHENDAEYGRCFEVSRCADRLDTLVASLSPQQEDKQGDTRVDEQPQPDRPSASTGSTASPVAPSALPPPSSDAEVIAAVRGVLWDAMRWRELGGDRTLVGMVKQLVAERDEARENRRGEYELRMMAEVAVRRVIADPHGCPFCDSGELRGKKPHADDCGFALASDYLSLVSPQKPQPPPVESSPVGEVQKVIAKLPELRGWDEAERISDWPYSYRERVVAYLLALLSADPSQPSKTGQEQNR